MSRDLTSQYQALLAEGKLRPDPAQARAVAGLQQLQHALAGYQPPRPAAGGLLARLGLARNAPAAAEAPRGLYLHGPVGRGKSMLMDLFFAQAAVARKRRAHFHAFMLDVHARLNARRQDGAAGQDPLAPVARDLADEAWLLCFDEFQVTDIADAMILGRLFEGLFAHGVVVVATSNWPPERLYENGLNRDRFLPFIALLQERLEAVALAGRTDYRLDRLQGRPVYHTPLGAQADAALAATFVALTDDAPGQPETIKVNSRTLQVPRAAHGVAWFDFATLCETPLGAADYLALTDRYHTLIVAGVPRLTPDKRNEARRFVTLVDALYERRINLVLSAAVPPGQLYTAGDGAFEFQRTVSRLMEMQSRAYLDREKGERRADFVPFALTTDVI